MLLQVTKILSRDSTYYFKILSLSLPLFVFSNHKVVMSAGRRLFLFEADLLVAPQTSLLIETHSFYLRPSLPVLCLYAAPYLASIN